MSVMPWDRFEQRREIAHEIVVDDAAQSQWDREYDAINQRASVEPEQRAVEVYAPTPRDDLQQLITTAVAAALAADTKRKSKIMEKFAEARKAVIAFVGSLVAVLTFITNGFGGLLPHEWMNTLGITVGILTTVLTWLTPNAHFAHVDADGNPDGK